MANLKFLRGTSEKWATLELKDKDSFYVVEHSDTGGTVTKYELYLGDKLIADGSTLEQLQKLSDKVDGIIGTGSTIDEQIEAAIALLDKEDTATAKNFVTSVKQTDGIIEVTRGEVKSTKKSIAIENGLDGGIDLDVNVDGTSLVIDGETGKISVANSALIAYTGSNAITVSEVQGGTKTISLKLNSADKVLSQSEDGLTANINLTWSSSDGLKLIGKDGTEIATIPATDFIKDGMLENVTLEENPSGQSEGTYLVFDFNTDAGDEKIYLDVTELSQVYTANSGVTISDNVISAKIKDGELILKVAEDGLSIDKNELSKEVLNTKYDSALSSDLKTPNDIGGLKKGTSVSTLEQKTFSQLFDDILFEEIQPTVQNPSCSIAPTGSWNNNGIYEVGAAAPSSEEDFKVTFNRGTCTVVGQDNKYRAGTETGRTIKLGSGDLAEGSKITLGTLTYNLTVNYGEGDLLLTSKGNKASVDPNPLTAGAVTASCKIYGTYPYFCNGANASTSNKETTYPDAPAPNTKLTLQQWTQALIGAKFASEAATETRLVFEYPKAKNVTKVEFFNTVSNAWEVFGSDKYTTSAIANKTIQDVEVEYMQLTTVGNLQGALQLRFTMANASMQSSDEPYTYNGEVINDEIIAKLAENSSTTPFVATLSDVQLLASTGNRPSGVAVFAVNFEPGGQAPLDARLLVPTKADLIAAETYSAKNVYNGMVVSVLDDDGEVGLYMLKDMESITSPDYKAWEKIDAKAAKVTVGNGLKNSDGTISVKLDEATESFLTVSEAGVKLSGVQGAIDKAVTAVTETVTSLQKQVETNKTDIQALKDATVTGVDNVKVQEDEEGLGNLTISLEWLSFEE